ncbi:MAG: hypothetical protein WC848_05560 [Parcubacteria group bacterium]|jgi:hypothetical protein
MQKLKIFFLIIFFYGVFGLVKNSFAATINIADYGDGDCSLENAQSAYDAASSGDTIVFPAFTVCTWSSAFTVSKALTISGNNTNLISDGAMSNGFFNITGFTASSLVRVSGFTFQMMDWTPATAVYVHDMQGGVDGGNIRIDNNTFYYGNKAIVFDHIKGLIDHNYFHNSIQGVVISAGSRTNADAAWVSLAAGTVDAIFIEDNHFVSDANYTLGYTQEQIGTNNGGKLVVRYNEFDCDNVPDGLETCTPFMAHGSADGGCGGAGYWEASSCQRRGQSVIEFYNNIEHGKRIDFMFISRGSANLVYNNSISSIVSNNPRIYFSEEEYISDNWSIHRTAWPAEDQVHNTFVWDNIYAGHDFNDGLVGSIGTYPTNYDCTGNGVPMACCTGSGTGTCGDELVTTSNPFLRQDRDYFLHAPCAAGDTTDGHGNVCTHGKETFIGQNGASASYPTDDSVYPNAGDMIFSATGDNAYVDYTPYIYPHPLQGETDITPPVSPSGLSVD